MPAIVAGCPSVTGINQRRVLVVGASSGLGRDIGDALAARGARVAFAARRVELVRDAAARAGDGCVGLACDVRDDAACTQVVADAIEHLGGLDTLVYAAAIGPLVDLIEAGGDPWRAAFDVNVIGASLVTRAAAPHLRESGTGKALYLSSVTGGASPPWPGLSVYAVSKAALDRLVVCWQTEYPGVVFTDLVLGPTAGSPTSPSSFADGWGPGPTTEAVERWIELGLMDGALVPSDDVCARVIDLLSSDPSTATVVIQP
jgi:NAD(P)-dependent dehydrogenase (short-subunit alcohol dehydrogenase family)